MKGTFYRSVKNNMKFHVGLQNILGNCEAMTSSTGYFASSLYDSLIHTIQNSTTSLFFIRFCYNFHCCALYQI